VDLVWWIKISASNWGEWLNQTGIYHGEGIPNRQFELSPLAQQKKQELIAVLAEDGFGGGRLPKEADFATINGALHEHSTNVSPKAMPNEVRACTLEGIRKTR